MAGVQVLQCNSCGGVYRTVQGDGLVYYHACPFDQVVTPEEIDPVTHEITKPAVRAPIENRRDENVVVIDRSSGAVGIKAEGAGVTPITEAAVLKRFGLAAPATP